MNRDLQINQNAEQTYHSIRNSIVSAQHRLSAAVNSTMVITYWEMGEQIYKACGENDRAEYGKKLLQYLSEQLIAEFGKGFSVQGLRNMRQFYCTFPIRSTLWSELSLVPLSAFDACARRAGKDFLCGRMCKICVECPTTGTADQYNVLSTYFSQSG